MLGQIDDVLVEKEKPSKNFCMLIHKYETERCKLLQIYNKENLMTEDGVEKWFPSYILNSNKNSQLSFSEKLE